MDEEEQDTLFDALLVAKADSITGKIVRVSGRQLEHWKFHDRVVCFLPSFGDIMLYMVDRKFLEKNGDLKPYVAKVG